MTLTTAEAIWMGVGFAGQFIFTARFLVQWAASEKKREPVVPLAFWWISLLGGLTLLTYAIHKADPPFILGQGVGLAVYIRNLMLADKARRREVVNFLYDECPTRSDVHVFDAAIESQVRAEVRRR